MFPGVPYMVGDTLAYTVAWPGLLFVTEGLSATLRVLTRGQCTLASTSPLWRSVPIPQCGDGLVLGDCPYRQRDTPSRVILGRGLWVRPSAMPFGELFGESSVHPLF